MAAQTCVAMMKISVPQAEAEGDITHTSLDEVHKSVGNVHKMKMANVRETRNALLKESSLITSFAVAGNRGRGSDECDKSKHMVLDEHEQTHVFNHTEQEHAKGATVANSKLRHEILSQLKIEILRSTLQGCLKRMGLTWRPTKPRKKTFKAHRKDSIGTFLIECAKARADPEMELSFADESFIHKGCGRKNSHMDDESRLNRGSGKGQRLIILHAITKHCPLCELHRDGTLADNLEWNRDTPHPKEAPDGLKSAECL